MEKSNRFTFGVTSLVDLAREINPEIGYYEFHIEGSIERGFSIKLSNGKVDVSVQLASDYEINPDNISEEVIRNMARTFRRLN